MPYRAELWEVLGNVEVGKREEAGVDVLGVGEEKQVAKMFQWMFYVEKVSGCMSIKCSERRGPSCKFSWQGPSRRFSWRGQSYKFSWQHRQRVNLDNQYIIKEDFNTIGALVNSSPEFLQQLT